MAYLLQTATIRCGCLGMGHLCAADYVPGLLGIWTFKTPKPNLIFLQKSLHRIFFLIFALYSVAFLFLHIFL